MGSHPRWSSPGDPPQRWLSLAAHLRVAASDHELDLWADADVQAQVWIEKEDLGLLAELLEAGTVKSVIDRRYELSRASEAFAYLGRGHARGKVVITP